MRQITVTIDTEDQTRVLGSRLARLLQPGLTLYLYGELGAGKTTLTRAVLRAAGHTGPVKSPTYALAEHYRIPLNGKAVELVHFDLYRMTAPEEFADAGFLDYFGGQSICIVEWPEKAAGILPAADVDARFDMPDTGRKITFSASSAAGETLISALEEAV